MRYYIIAGALLFAAAHSPVAISPAQAQQPSSFQKSCKDYKYVVDKKGQPGFTASCTRGDGRTWMTSGVPFGGVHNKEGRLSATGGPNTFHKSCRNIRVEVAAGVPQIAAECRTTAGQWLATTSRIWDLDNKDGTLTYRFAGASRLEM